MKKKEEIYVVVDTPKKAKKVKKILDIFGENHTPRCFTGYTISANRIHFKQSSGKFWNGFDNMTGNKTKVSIKELRNILAAEHLKVGDVVVIGNDYLGKWIVELRGGSFLSHSKSYLIGGNGNVIKGSMTATACKFLRYATEEEKELLKHKKLEVGKWYKYSLDSYDTSWTGCNILFNFSGNYGNETQYGFNFRGEWSDSLGFHEGDSFIESTNQEVKDALIKEAKRRYIVGDVLSEVVGDSSLGDRVFSHDLNYQSSNNSLWIENDNGYYSCIYCEGKWADVVEKMKEDELLNPSKKVKLPSQK